MLSFLDLLPVASGAQPGDVIRGAETVARAAETAGYHRYWVAEHHNMPSIASAAPDILIAHVAARTSRIRVGAGGVMLPNHAPLRIVEAFRTLEALHPGRIDLGLGRAPGTDPVTAAALRRGSGDDPNERLSELMAFEHGTFPPQHPFHQIAPTPAGVSLPPVWMLGSTTAGAAIGASLGVRYAFAGHFAMRNAAAAIGLYRARFQPSAALAAPYAMLAVTVICGEDDDHALRMAGPVRLAIARSLTGKRLPIATEEEARAHRFSPEEEAAANGFLEGAIIGGPARVRSGLETVKAATGADEIMVSTLVPALDQRLSALARVAACTGTEPGPA
ncbi:MAG: LLM class flavin-dependent oxidoreductase [Vicinamibacterales bacterium]